MYQTDHAERDGNRDAGTHQSTVTRCQLDVLGAEQVDARIAVVGAAGHREAGVEADYGQTGRHGGTDYP